MSFVLDASLTLAWCFDDERTDFAAAVLDALPRVGAVVPPIWILEVANGLRTARQRQRIDEVAATSFANLLRPLPVQTVFLDAGTMLCEVRLMALEHELSAYDASYLFLARCLRLPVATLDGSGRRMGLRQAADRLAVPIVAEQHLRSWATERHGQSD